jgi:RNA polymerase sigma-70 factor (ECF subfamily)
MTDQNDNHGRGKSAPSTSSTRLSFLAGLRDRSNQDAWRRLTYVYGPLVELWCLGKGIPRTEIDDIVQEVFLAVAKGIKGFRRERADDTFRGWLRTITANKMADWMRKRARRRGEVSLAVAPAKAVSLDEFDEDEDAANLAGLYARAFDLVRDQFEEKSWQAFWRVTVEQEDVGTVAADLNMTRSALYNVKSRILRRLREILGD